MAMSMLAEGLMWFAVFVFSSTCHEAAHAWAALRLGDRTAYEGGQVSLNPLPHMRREVFGMVIMPWLSFLLGGWMIGWASAPYDPRWAMSYPKRSALMALAGPCSNLVLVIIAVILIKIGLTAGYFQPPSAIRIAQAIQATDPAYIGAAKLLSILFSLNLILFVFNLLPVPPLDGSGAVPLFLSEPAARKYMEMVQNPAWQIGGLFLAWYLFGPIFRPIYRIAVRLLYA